MTTYVVLLRGVNLGSRRRISMGDLRALLTGLGYDGVRTHLQSGNALLGAPGRSTETVAAEIEAAISDRFGMSVRCLVRDAAELRRVVGHDPFGDVVTDPSRFLVVFLSGPVPPEVRRAPDPLGTTTPGPDGPGSTGVAGTEPGGPGVGGVAGTGSVVHRRGAEAFAVGEREIYLWLSDGMRRAVLTPALWEKRTGLVATARNWNTVTRLLAMAEE